MSVLACGGGGGSSDAGPEPPPPVLATDSERTQAAAGAALTLVALTTALVSEPPRVIGAPAAGALLAAAWSAAVGVGAAARTGEAVRPVRVPCAGGGTLDGSCSERDGATTVTSLARECEIVDSASGLTITANGELTARLSATGVCRSGVVPDDVEATYRFSDFRATTSDGAAVIETFDAPMLVQRVEPRPGGCGEGDGLTVYDGGLGLTRAGGLAVELVLSDLRLELRSGGVPCGETITAAGRLEVSDRVAAHTFTAEPHGVQIGWLGGASPRSSIDGPVTIGCVGAVVYATEAGLAIATPCATAGALRIDLPSGASARATFTAGAVALDYDSDGQVDASAASCVDPALARCGE